MKKILIIYGGNSYEHDISILSAENVIKGLKELNYEFDQIYISKENKWYLIKNEGKAELLNIIEFLKRYDIIFPVMHGAFGEDGRIQSFFELFNIKYKGSNSSASMISMNKYFTKLVVEKENIKQLPYIYLNNTKKIPKLKYPVIVKPANGGSSIGISIAHSFKELKSSLKNAFKYDKNVIVEKFIKCRELECAILGEKKLIIGDVGEIKHQHEFYDFEAKYKDNSEIIIPAKISYKLKKLIQSESKKIFKVLNLKDFARIDFLFDEENDTLYFNEVNTIPGFTNISMFPKLFNGMCFSKLISNIIEN